VVVSRRLSETSVEIEWAADVAIANNPLTSSYRLYLDDLSGNTVAPIAVDTPQQLLKDLVLGHSYQVSVSAVNAIGEGAKSAPVLALHTGLAPSKMTGTSAPSLDSSTSTSITIKWLPPSYNGGASLAEYVVYHDVGRTGTFHRVPLTDLTVTTWTLSSSSPGVTSLATGQLVDFYMASTNVIGESLASDILTLYVAAVPSQPSTPSETSVFSVQNGASYASEIGIKIDWVSPADNGAPIKGYKLFMAEEQAPSQLIFDGSSSSRADILTYTVREGITKSLVYKFKVQAVNAVGESLLSAELAVPATVPPSAPFNLTVLGSGSGSVTLEWSPPLETGGAAILGYRFYYQTQSALTAAPSTWLTSSLVSAAVDNFALSGLTADLLYRIKMVANNARGNGDYSSSVSQYAGAVPTQLAALAVIAGARGQSSLGISWSAPGTSTTAVLGYQLYINEPDSNAIPTRLVYDGAAISTLLQAKVTGLVSQRTYWFSYRVRNRAGWSSTSTPYLKVVAGPLPSPPATAPVQVSTS